MQPSGMQIDPNTFDVCTTGIVYLSMKLLTFRRWADEHRHVLRFCVCFLVMLLELSFENGMVW